MKVFVNRRYCSVKELSEYTSLPKKTVYDWVSEGLFPSIKIRRRILFDLRDIDEFMAVKKQRNVGSDVMTNEIIDEINDNV